MSEQEYYRWADANRSFTKSAIEHAVEKAKKEGRDSTNYHIISGVQPAPTMHKYQKRLVSEVLDDMDVKYVMPETNDFDDLYVMISWNASTDNH